MLTGQKKMMNRKAHVRVRASRKIIAPNTYPTQELIRQVVKIYSQFLKESNQSPTIGHFLF